jgi:hypothetical protein
MQYQQTEGSDAGDTTRSTGGRARRARVRYWRVVVAVAAVALAVFLLDRATDRYSLETIIESVRGFSAERLAAVGFFAAASYVCLTGFDFLATRYVRRPVPYPYVAMTSFVSLSLGHNIGFAALSSGMIRYRFYSRYGLSPFDIARVILFCGITVGLGLLVLGGLALIGDRDLSARIVGAGPAWIAWIGAGFLCLVAVYFLVCIMWRRPRSFRGWPVRFPSARLAVAQLLIGPLNFALVAACLHQAVGGAADVSYTTVAAVYVLANIATIISHVPGGLGVIESVVLLLIPGEAVIGALVVFRVAYFLVPLVIGTGVFAVVELVRVRQRKTSAAV